MLIDKGYYDYDYSDPYDERKERLKALKPKSNAELQEKLSRMGFGNIMAKEKPSQPLTPDEMQRIAMQEARERKSQ